MIRLTLTAVALAVSGAALAKLPPLDDAAKAKAAETAARAAWQGKVDAYKLCQVQDRIAAQYKSKRPAVAVPGGAVVPTTAAPAAPTAGTAPAAPAATSTPTTAAAAAAIAKAPSNSTNPTTASQGGGTPVPNVASAAPAGGAVGCADPGPFAYNPPSQTPLETSGAHSPAGNAAAPPSVRPESAQMAPSGGTTSQSKKP
jgi:hypothetical protein